MKKKFLVFICPNCEQFTYIPAENRIRICNHCGRMIVANPQNSKSVHGLRRTYAEVREYGKKGGKRRFFLEVGASSEPNNVSIEDLKDFEVDVQSPKDGRLVHILKNYCLKSTSLDYFHKMCVKAQLDWDWVGKRIILLANQGGIIFPNPWTIKYIMTDLQPDKEEKPRVLKRRKIVGTRLWQLFGRSSEPVSEGYIYSKMKDRGYEQEEVEPVLNDLINEGYIIRPRPGFLRFIEDWRD